MQDIYWQFPIELASIFFVISLESIQRVLITFL